jgi:anti-sigma regulatory factor (Ser/Thr protein kinase)
MASRTWRFAAVPECVSGTRHAVAAFAADHGVPEPPLEDLTLALSEAVTNAVVHGYRFRATGVITVVVEIDPATVRVTVADDGAGLAPRFDSPGAGMGLPLIGALADAVEIAAPPEGPGTVVRMRFGLTA